jgi:hypothetical protein
LLLDSPLTPRCFAEVIEHIQHSNFARIELLVFNAGQPGAALPPPAATRMGKLLRILRDRKLRSTLLFTLYQRWDRRNVAAGDDPVEMVDCSARFDGIETLSVTPITQRFVHRFPPEAIETIRDKQLDVLLRFGFNILRGDILTAARYGVWGYHHGDNDFYRGGPAHFWEVYEGCPLSGVILQVLTEQLDAGKVLCKGWFQTEPGLSLARNRIQPYYGASTFLIQKLKELHERGWEHLERNSVPPAPYHGRKKIYTAPTNVEMVRWLGPALIRKSLRRLVRRPKVAHWRMAIRTGAGPVLDSGPEPDLSGFRWIESPVGRFYADPFVIEESGRPWVFFEDYDYGASRGRISCAEVRNGELGEVRPALERPYHLSYPCVFRDGGALYMIPETATSGAVELYRCTRFPDGWEFQRELLKLRAVDTTLWIEDGVYWLFTTLQEPRGFGIQLWLFYAETLDGEWTPHPANPLSTDVRGSRGAGAVFRHEGKRYRPSQDCSRNYGYSFTFNEIVAMNREEYRAEPRATVNPVWSPGLVGTHTYSRAGPVELIDGCAPLAARRVLG